MRIFLFIFIFLISCSETVKKPITNDNTPVYKEFRHAGIVDQWMKNLTPTTIIPLICDSDYFFYPDMHNRLMFIFDEEKEIGFSSYWTWNERREKRVSIYISADWITEKNSSTSNFWQIDRFTGEISTSEWKNFFSDKTCVRVSSEDWFRAREDLSNYFKKILKKRKI